MPGPEEVVIKVNVGYTSRIYDAVPETCKAVKGRIHCDAAARETPGRAPPD